MLYSDDYDYFDLHDDIEIEQQEFNYYDWHALAEICRKELEDDGSSV